MKHSTVRHRSAAACFVLSCLTLVGAAHAGGPATPGPRVEYDPPRLSVEAQEASPGAVLRAIGATVGFSVVEMAPSSRAVTVSMRNATLEEVLRQVLREENHAVLYRAGAGGMPGVAAGIDTIVLLGEPRRGTSTPENAQLAPGQPRSAASASPPPPAAWLDTRPRMPRGLALAPPSPGDSAEPSVTVGDLLKAHAIAVVPGASPGRVDTAAPAPSASISPPDLGAALAQATRRAQQAVRALTDGLAAATRSLYEPRSGEGKR
jgi:hypothetical protein